MTDARDARERYLEHLVSSPGPGPAPAPGTGTGRAGGLGATTPADAGPLAGLRVVVDCAHGAAYGVAPAALRRGGAEVIVIGAQPDGLNINEGYGSTHLDALIGAVIANSADAGIAHDGDADRCLAVTADGQTVDGDQILAILAVEFKDAQRLAGDTVVTTVMANLGFRRAMKDAGIRVVETAVGDRYVLEAMQAGGYVLGGEQSGHIIMLEHATTGDGVLTALHLLGAIARRGLALGELAKVMQRFPQVLINVPDVDKSRVSSSPGLATAVAAAGPHPPEWDRARGPRHGRGSRARPGRADCAATRRGRPRRSRLRRRCGHEIRTRGREGARGRAGADGAPARGHADEPGGGRPRRHMRAPARAGLRSTGCGAGW